MTGKEALDLANGILRSVGEGTLDVPTQTGTEKDRVRAVLNAYMARLRKNQPLFADIEDRLLPDMVVQRLREELGKMM